MPPAREFLGKTVAEVFPVDLAKRLMLHIEATLSSGAIQSFEHELPSDGETRHFESRIIPGEYGTVLVIVGTAGAKVSYSNCQLAVPLLTSV